ncbi:ThiF family adenylyltransferase [Methyloversatilis sp.]|uniref:HesA/MoeB/ThiF family protein n=1 Tax=Methyloversatilis sp. TaxID=2569862 RepID=UPI0035B0EE00
MNDQQLLRYSRHILLDPIGIEGQNRLLASHALIVGAGGLGCPSALYLAAAGVGTLTIVDDDEVDLTNLQRQILHREKSVGRAKVESARDALHDINPGTEVIALRKRLCGDELLEQVAAADVVLDCSDNFATRHAINRACVASRTPLVSGAAIRFDGQVSVFDSRQPDAPCYHCLFPEGGEVEEVRCAVMGVFAPLTGIIGTVQAAEALKVLAQTGRTLAGRLLLLDALGMEWRSITLPRDPGCAVCGEGAGAPGP